MAAPDALKDSFRTLSVRKESLRASPRRRSRDPAARRPLTGLLFVAPTAAVVAVFFLLPLGILVYMSFTDWPLLASPTPNGVDNYTSLTDDDLFVGAITFTLVYTAITTVVLFLVAFALVAISGSRRRGVRLYRTAYFLPYVVGTAAASTMWWVDAHDQLGVFNQIPRALGIIHEPVGFLATPSKALFTVIALVVWKFVGFQVIVLLVGLQS